MEKRLVQQAAHSSFSIPALRSVLAPCMRHLTHCNHSHALHVQNESRHAQGLPAVQNARLTGLPRRSGQAKGSGQDVTLCTVTVEANRPKGNAIPVGRGVGSRLRTVQEEEGGQVCFLSSLRPLHKSRGGPSSLSHVRRVLCQEPLLKQDELAAFQGDEHCMWMQAYDVAAMRARWLAPRAEGPRNEALTTLASYQSTRYEFRLPSSGAAKGRHVFEIKNLWVCLHRISLSRRAVIGR